MLVLGAADSLPKPALQQTVAYLLAAQCQLAAAAAVLGLEQPKIVAIRLDSVICTPRQPMPQLCLWVLEIVQPQRLNKLQTADT